MQLIFATNNDHKIKEFRSLLGAQFKILSLREAGLDLDIPEPHNTLEANATEKSSTIYQITGQNCFAEDTGLEVSALKGAPGVLSARYAGEEKIAANNIIKVLKELDGISDRSAQFRTIISLMLDGKENQFEGICKGHITTATTGGNGFGYDPIFVPEGASCSFAEMSLAEKNQYSHRARAFEKFVHFLQNIHLKYNNGKN